jgi:hypothetical protein
MLFLFYLTGHTTRFERWVYKGKPTEVTRHSEQHWAGSHGFSAQERVQRSGVPSLMHADLRGLFPGLARKRRAKRTL